MPLNIRSEPVNQLATKLVARARVNKSEAVRMALENELHRLDAAVPLRERAPSAAVPGAEPAGQRSGGG